METMDIVLVILGLALLILAHEFGHFSVAKILKMRVDEFGIGFPPRIFGKKKGETLYSVNALPFGGFVKIYGEDEERENNPEAFLNKPFGKKSMVVLAGILMNFLLGWIFLSIVFAAGTPEHLMVTGVSPNSPAAAAGLKEGDVVEEVSSGGITLSDPVKSADLVSMVKNSGISLVSFRILRDSKILDVSVGKRQNPPTGQGALGIDIADIGSPPEPFFKAVGDALVETAALSWLILRGLWTIVTGLFMNPNVLQGIAGPVGIVALASNTASIGFAYLVQLLALISINLAVLNLVPFPALDGGRFLIFLIEKVRRKRVSLKVQLVANGVGFAALILLMIFVTFNDVRNLMVH